MAAADRDGGRPDGGAVPADEAAQARQEALARAEAARAAVEAEKPPWERTPEAPHWEEMEDLFTGDLRQRHGTAVLGVRRFAGQTVVEVGPEGLVALARDLRDEEGFRLLVDLCGVDHGVEVEPRFSVVYHLRDLVRRRLLRLRVDVLEGEEVPSLTPVFAGANWPEREVWDLFGIPFAGHPGLTRILLWEGFEGHPLRKDFPVEGISTGSAAYSERYEEGAGPVSAAGTGWLVPSVGEGEPGEGGGEGA